VEVNYQLGPGGAGGGWKLELDWVVGDMGKW